MPWRSTAPGYVVAAWRCCDRWSGGRGCRWYCCSRWCGWHWSSSAGDCSAASCRWQPGRISTTCLADSAGICSGTTQHAFLELIQVADLTGVYGVSFLVAAANAVLFEALYGRPAVRRLLGDSGSPRWRRSAVLAQAVAVAALLLGTLWYGTFRIGEIKDLKQGPRLALLQTNVDQRLRNASSLGDDDSRSTARKRLLRQVEEVAVLAAGRGVDLVVTPETSYPGTWGEFAPGRPTDPSREFAVDRARAFAAPVLLGLNSFVYEADGKSRGYNSAVLVDRAGEWQGRYDKVHRVPFGEYIPVRRWLPFLDRLAPYEDEYSVEPGQQFTRFTLPGAREPTTFGVVICYEDTDPAMARAYMSGDGRPVDFLLNISNDGWFDGSSEHDQHLAICRFRAIECRRTLARSVNMGISAVVDPVGRVLAPRLVSEVDGVHLWEIPDAADPLPVWQWHEFKQTAGVLLARVPLDNRVSFYARRGDLFALLTLGTVACLLIASRFRRRATPP
ncbi:MAG: apolipoprotein N-acyltransferase [Gemmataceae bacterium]